MTDDTDVKAEDIYVSMIRTFNDQTGITERADRTAISHGQNLDVVQEEVDELEDAIEMMQLVERNQGQFTVTEPRDFRAEIAEELADVIISAMSMGVAQDIDVRRAFKKKMEYNFNKTGDKVVDGKVVDDSDIEKPDFGDCLLERREGDGDGD